MFRNNQIRIFSEPLQKALTLNTGKDDASAWLLGVSCFYEWVGKWLRELFDEWETIKDDYLKKKKTEDGGD